MVTTDSLLRELCIRFFTHKNYFMVEGVPYLVVDLNMHQYVRYKEALKEQLQPIEDKKVLSTASIVSCYVVSNLTTTFAQKTLCAVDEKDISVFDESFDKSLLNYLYVSLTKRQVKGKYFIYNDYFNRDVMKRFEVTFMRDIDEPAHLKVSAEAFHILEERIKSLCDEKL